MYSPIAVYQSKDCEAEVKRYNSNRAQKKVVQVHNNAPILLSYSNLYYLYYLFYICANLCEKLLHVHAIFFFDDV